ncbi:uncharacterized protein V6R79_004645 [Siganus canaliculatus]
MATRRSRPGMSIDMQIASCDGGGVERRFLPSLVAAVRRERLSGRFDSSSVQRRPRPETTTGSVPAAEPGLDGGPSSLLPPC